MFLVIFAYLQQVFQVFQISLVHIMKTGKDGRSGETKVQGNYAANEEEEEPAKGTLSKGLRKRKVFKLSYSFSFFFFFFFFFSFFIILSVITIS